MEIKRNEATINRPDGDRVLDAPYVFIDLPAFIDQIKREKAWEKNDRNGITVFKSSELTLVITALQATATLDHNNVQAHMTVQVIEGEMRIATTDGDVTMKSGNVMAFHPGVPHTIHATTDVILLITIFNHLT